MMWPLFAALALSSGCGRPHDTEKPQEDELPSLQAMAGNQGVYLWTDGDFTQPLVLERNPGDGWLEVGGQGPTWWLPATTPDPPGTLYRLIAEGGALIGNPVSALAVGLSLVSDPSSGILFTDEPLGLAIHVDGPQDWPDARLRVAVRIADTELWLDPECDGCWLPVPAEQALTEPIHDIQATFVPTAIASPVRTAIEASVVVPTAEGDMVSVGTASASTILTGRTLLWGDLHAQSGLSNDGCEDNDNGCMHRQDLPGRDYFALARAAGLDFAALTDHAEYATYLERASSKPIDIWSLAREHLSDAMAVDDGFIPLLGFEWTSRNADDGAGHLQGGHRTVILEGSAPCEDYMLSSDDDQSQSTKLYSGEIYRANPRYVTTPAALWAALGVAQTTCEYSRILSFPHHSAYSCPASHDFTWMEYAASPPYDALIEVTSEHGTSECAFVDDPYCDWRLSPDEALVPEGAVRTALNLGYRYGFTAGTDAHDGRPGSLDDGASCLGVWGDPDNDGIRDVQVCLTYPGGLTGAYAPARGDRGQLFDALLARHTLATSGPRLRARVAAIAGDGDVYLPGDDIPASDADLELQVRLSEALEELGAKLLSIEILRGDGQCLLESTESDLDLALDLISSPVVYLRVRMEWQGEEERVWISPFFLEKG